MAGECEQKQCMPHRGGCVLGNGELADCPHFEASEPRATTEAESAAGIPSPATFPWSGDALGTADLSYLACRQRPRVVGLLGAADAGKTTFLVACYLHLLRGHPLSQRHFAGSLTLSAWEALAAWTRWTSERSGSFPPHTTSQDARQPGLLHISLRGEQALRDEVVLTDAPGEWFEKWSANEDDPQAEGARWTARHADSLVIVADSARLSGSRCGASASHLQRLISRVANHVGDRPVSLLWSKSDRPVPGGIKRRVEGHLKEWLPNADSLSTRIDQPESFLTAADAILAKLLATRPTAYPAPPSIEPSSPFLSYRGAQ